MGFLQRAFGGGGDTPQPDNNILSTLASPAVKALQVSGSQVGQQYDPSMPEDRYAPAAIQPETSVDAPRQSRPRASAWEVLGTLGDAIARIQKAPEIYQPFADAAHLRDRQAIEEPMQDTLNQQKIDIGQNTLQDHSQAQLGQALGSLSDDPAEAAQQWASVAQQIPGVTPEKAAQIGQLLQAKPGLGKVLAQSLGYKPGDKYSGSIVYGRDPNTGKVIAYQPSTTGENGRALDLGPGIEAINPTLVNNDTRLKTTRMNNDTRLKTTRMTNDTRVTTTKMNNDTSRYVADTRPGPKGGKDAGGGEDPTNVPRLLNNIMGGFNTLHSLGALPGDTGNKFGAVGGAISRSGIGQAVGEQLGTPAAQKRLEIMKNVSALQQAMLKSLPASATRTKFEQEMLARGLPDPAKMSLPTAQTVIKQLQESYMSALAASRKEVGGGRPTLAPKPAAGGWGKATVIQ